MIVYKEFDYTHKALGNGNLRFQFGENELLCGIQIEAELTPEFLAKLIARAPISMDDLEYWRSRPSGKLIEFKEQITFNQFYDTWGMKGGEKRSKMRAEKLWVNMAGYKQRKAFRSLNAFFMKQKPGQNIMHCDRYLREEAYND